MKNKIIKGIAALTMIISMGVLGSAWADAVGVGGSAPQATWDPPIMACSAGDTWHFRSHTYNFGPLDSTGTTTFRIWYESGASLIKSYSNVEHDGVTRVWNSGKQYLHKGTFSYSGLSSIGIADVSIYCT